MIEYAIKNIQEQNRIILIEDLLKKNQPTSINEKLSNLIEAANKRKKELDFHLTTSSEISPEIAVNFINFFIEEFYKCCSLRLLFKQYNLLNQTNETVEENGIGINELLPKKAFLKENDVIYFNLHGSLAAGLADSENLSILYSSLKAASKKNLTEAKLDFEKFLTDNKE